MNVFLAVVVQPRGGLPIISYHVDNQQLLLKSLRDVKPISADDERLRRLLLEAAEEGR